MLERLGCVLFQKASTSSRLDLKVKLQYYVLAARLCKRAATDEPGLSASYINMADLLQHNWVDSLPGTVTIGEFSQHFRQILTLLLAWAGKPTNNAAVSEARQLADTASGSHCCATAADIYVIRMTCDETFEITIRRHMWHSTYAKSVCWVIPSGETCSRHQLEAKGAKLLHKNTKVHLLQLHTWSAL